MPNIKTLKRTSIPLVVNIVILSVIGLMNVFSTTFFPAKEVSQLFWNQILFVGVGFLLFFVLSSINYSIFQSKFFIGFVSILTIVLLILVIFIGEQVYGAQRWIRIGSFTIQPSEFTKISVILITAWVNFRIAKYFKFSTANIGVNHGLSLRKKIQSDASFLTNYFIKFKKIKKIYIPYPTLFSLYLFNLAIFLGLVFIQNSLGNGILILLIAFLTNVMAFKFNKELLFIVSSFFVFFFFSALTLDLELVLGFFTFFVIVALFFRRKREFNFFILFLISLGAIFVPFFATFSYENLLQDYQRQRIDTFISPEDFSYGGELWNLEQSKTAVATAGLLGKGFMNSQQSNALLLPFPYTDFAFASFAEQFGLVGIAFLFMLYSALVYQIIQISYRTEDVFAYLILFGVIFLIMLNVIQHSGMNLGRLPITGVPLPLISYGGSSTLIIFIGLGLVSSVNNSISRNRIKVIN